MSDAVDRWPRPRFVILAIAGVILLTLSYVRPGRTAADPRGVEDAVSGTPRRAERRPSLTRPLAAQPTDHAPGAGAPALEPGPEDIAWARQTVEAWLERAGHGELVELECDALPCIAMLRSDDGRFGKKGAYIPGPLGRVLQEEAGGFRFQRATAIATGAVPGAEVVILFAPVGATEADDRAAIRARTDVLGEMAVTHLELTLEDGLRERGWFVLP